MAKKPPEDKYELGPIGEQAIWDVWRYVRVNRDSLESDRHCKGVSRLVRLAMAEMEEVNGLQRKTMKDAISEKRKLQNLNRELKKDVKVLEDELRDVRDELDECKKKLERLQSVAPTGKKAVVKKRPSRRKKSPLRKFVQKRRSHSSIGRAHGF